LKKKVVPEPMPPPLPRPPENSPATTGKVKASPGLPKSRRKPSSLFTLKA